jgi:hypothetical protein
MKTKELLAILQQADPEHEVSFLMNSGCCGDFEEMEAEECYVSGSVEIQLRWATIRLKAVPGYKSCIQAGNALKADRDYWEKHNPSVLEES